MKITVVAAFEVEAAEQEAENAADAVADMLTDLPSDLIGRLIEDARMTGKTDQEMPDVRIDLLHVGWTARED